MGGDEEDGRASMLHKGVLLILKIQEHLKIQFSVFVDGGRTCHM